MKLVGDVDLRSVMSEFGCERKEDLRGMMVVTMDGLYM